MRRFLGLLLPLVLIAAAQLKGAALPPTLKVGAAAPDFQLPATDGKTYSLKDFADAKLLVVLFTCDHCPTAQYYEERVKDVARDYENKGVRVVAIMPNDPKSVRLDEMAYTDVGDTFREMKIRAEERHFNFPYLYDGETESVSKAYGPVATPHVFVFDQARKLRYVGAIDNSERIAGVTKHYLRDALDSLLAGKEPAPAQTKVVGCSIKWATKESVTEEYMAKLAAEPVSVTLVDADGLKKLRQNDSGKFRLVNFWATWCAPCVAEFDELVAINRTFRVRDFEMVTVSLNHPDENASVLDFLKKKQGSERNLIFSSADRDPLINAFNPDWQGVVPYTVIIDPEGKVIYEETGSIDPLAVKRALVKALNERKPW
ncbi:MAG TPA: redoxin domain-containing protein [Opitutaceae bacterium]